MKINLSQPYRRNNNHRKHWFVKSWRTLFGFAIALYLLHWWLVLQGWDPLQSTTSHLDISRRGDIFLLSHYPTLASTSMSMLFEKELERLSIPHGHLQDIASDVKEKYIKTEGDDLLDLSDHFLWVGPIANHEAHSELSPSASIAWPTNMHKSESHSHYELHIESLPSGSILVFDSFPTVVQNLNFENIFQYFDDLILFVRYFRSLNKKLTMLWIMPKVSSLKYGSGIDELQAVFQHLTIMHVINRLGIMVTDASDLDHVKENVLHHLNMLHHFSLQHYETFPHEYGTLSKISTSHSAEFQHRVKLLSSYLSNFYSTEGQVVGSFNHFHGKTVISRESSTLQDACFKFVNTRKFSSTCFPSVGKRYPLLVTGLGGSGTHFVANSLQQLGFPINHESIGQLGSVSWFYAINDVWSNTTYPYGTLDSDDRSFLSPRFDHVIQVVREPMKQIAAFTTHSNKTYNFAFHSLSLIYKQDKEAMSVLRRYRLEQLNCARGEKCNVNYAAVVWVLWNKYVQSYADVVMPIEQTQQNTASNVVEDSCQILWRDFHALSTSSSCVDERKKYMDANILRTLWTRFFTKIFPVHEVHRQHPRYSLETLNRQMQDWLVLEAKQFSYQL